MAQEFQTSFIPKKTFDVGIPAKRPPSSISGILFFVAILFFIVSLLAAGGAFLYERFLISSIENKKVSLEKAKNAFEPELIRELSRLDAKLTIAQELLDEHLAPSSILDLLEEITLETVRFKTFSYMTDDLGVHIKLDGEARSFGSVALQSDEFSKNRSIREPVFTGFTLDERGDVEFTVDAIIDRALLSYRERADRGGSAFFDIEEGQVAGASASSDETNAEVPGSL